MPYKIEKELWQDQNQILTRKERRIKRKKMTALNEEEELIYHEKVSTHALKSPTRN